MIVYGIDRHFRNTVQAAADIADMCPDGDASRIGELMLGKPGHNMRVRAQIVCYLNAGYEAYAKFAGLESHDPLTVDAVMALSPQEFAALEVEAMTTYSSDGKTAVRLQPAKKKAIGTQEGR